MSEIACYAAKAAKSTLEPFSYQPAKLGAHDITVEISHCGICHSDIHLINNDWGVSKYPLVPGHEIIGTLKEAGDHVTSFKIGQRVGIGWQRSSCLNCEFCRKRGREPVFTTAGNLRRPPWRICQVYPGRQSFRVRYSRGARLGVGGPSPLWRHNRLLSSEAFRHNPS